MLIYGPGEIGRTTERYYEIDGAPDPLRNFTVGSCDPGPGNSEAGTPGLWFTWVLSKLEDF